MRSKSESRKRGLSKNCRSPSLVLERGSVQKKIGNCCGGFVQVDRDMTNLSEIQWARLSVKRVGKVLPGTLQLIVENLCVELQLWWEVLTWMSHVVDRVIEGDSQRVEVEEDAVSRADGRVGKEGVDPVFAKVAWEAEKGVLIKLKGTTLLRETAFQSKVEKAKNGKEKSRGRNG